MAAIADLTSIKVIAKLNNGTKDGKVQTVNLSLPELTIDGYNNNNGDEKAMAIINLLKPCLSKDVYEVIKVPTYVIKDAE